MNSLIVSKNISLKKNLIDTQEELKKSIKLIEKDQKKNEHLEFLELNLLHGHKCRKSFFKSQLYKIKTNEYKACVLRKGSIKKN